MSYVVLARKYRPQHFDEVIGQEHVATTLKNAIQLNRIAHAYLFTGPRGVGKTSVARIFSRALNCEKGPTADPCGKCASCMELIQERSLDVMEIDGASNRGIDEIRALRENVKFKPASSRFKIYIIDEFHQISNDAFNALLKTLEEPPAHVKFIFATTAVHKVPATILSRCQRFDFKRITVNQIASALKKIAGREKIKLNDEAAFVIARAADGSMRDAESILDQMVSFCDEKIDAAEVGRLLGVFQDEKIFELFDCLIDRRAEKALQLFHSLLQEGQEPQRIVNSCISHVRHLILLKVSDDLSETLGVPEENLSKLKNQKARVDLNELFYFFTLLTRAQQWIRHFELPLIPVEVALIKMAERQPMRPIEEIMSDLDKKGIDGRLNEPNLRMTPEALKKVEPVQIAREVESEEDDLSMVPPSTLQDIWQPLIAKVKLEKMSVASYLLEATPLRCENSEVVVGFPEAFKFHKEALETDANRKFLEKHIGFLLKQPVTVRFELLSSSVPASSTAGQTFEDLPSAASEDPSVQEDRLKMVRSAMDIFGGRVTKST